MTTTAPPRRVGRPRNAAEPRVRFRPPAPVETTAPVLDPSQRAVLEHRGGPLLVLAGPGTGKTTTVVELVAERVRRGLDPRQVLVLTFSTRAAAQLRARIGLRLGVTTPEPLARTFHSYAYGLLRRHSALAGAPIRRLLPAAEAQVLVAEVLAGLQAGEGRHRVEWPPEVARAVGTRAFAAEITDMLSRAAERGLGPDDLVRLGRRAHRPEWESLGRFAREYDEVVDARFPSATDQAGLVRAAVATLRADPSAAAAESDARRLVVVDEFQDCDPGQLDLLETIAGGGPDLVVVGDPDQSIYAFRGTATGAVEDFAERFRTVDGRPAARLSLSVCRRSGPVLLAATRAVAARLGGPAEHRRLTAGPGLAPGSVAVLTVASPAAETARTAGWLRAAHVRDGRRWSEMAVLTRSREEAASFRRALRQQGLPVAAAAQQNAVTDQPAAAALLDLLSLTLPPPDPGAGGGEVRPELIERLLAGPLGGVDTVARRRLRTTAARLGAAAGRGADDVLAAAFGDPTGSGTTGSETTALAAASPGVRRLLTALAAGRSAVRAGADARAVLWTVWSALDLATPWQHAALRGGTAGSRADRNLDGVIALGQQFDGLREERPGLALEAVLEEITERALGQGSQAPSDTDAVAVLTVHASKGLEWPLVAVVGLQEQRWPDLRRRGSLLGLRELVRAVDDPASAALPAAVAAAADRAQNLAEERRLFYVALTRAGAGLLITAVRDAEHQPSRFLEDIGPNDLDGATDGPPGEALAPVLVPADAAPGLDVRRLVATLRREVCDPVGPRRAAAAELLARLADVGVPGADPDGWWGLPALSDEAAISSSGRRDPADDEPTDHEEAPDLAPRLSPSGLEDLTTCPLRWFLTGPAGGQRASGPAAAVGTLIHALAEQVATGVLAVADLPDVFRDRAAALLAGEGWPQRRERHRQEAMVGHLQSWLAGRADVVAAAEVDFDAELDTAGGALRVVGKIDRLEFSEHGRVTVADFKTSKHPETKRGVAEHLQLGVYQLAVGSGGVGRVTARRPGEVPGGSPEVEIGLPPGTPVDQAVLVQLGLPKLLAPAQPTVDPAAVPEWLSGPLGEAARVLRGQSYEARPGTHCRHCPVSQCCPTQTGGGQVGA